MPEPQIFQEKHTARYAKHLWLKKYTYYKYFRYSEGSLVPVPVYQPITVQQMEKK